MDERTEPLFEDAFFRRRKKKGRYALVPQPVLEASVADTHAHLDMLDDVPLTLARSALHRLNFICAIADVFEDAHSSYTCLDEWRACAQKILPEVAAATAVEDLSEDRYLFPENPHIPRIRIAIGCHPHNAKHYSDDLEFLLLKRLRDPRTCALGEVGLDYHYDFSPRAVQREVFRAQIRLAHRCELPLILHLREAHDDALAIMEEEGFPEAGTLLHCYNLDSETLKPWTEHDCYVAFGGPLTFKQAEVVREAARGVARTRLLTETDAPFMTPEPMRGMMCGPEHSIFTAQKLAEVFCCVPGEERKVFLEQLYENARTLLDRDRGTACE